MKTEAHGLHVVSPTKSSAGRTQSLIVIECVACHYLGFCYMAYPEVEVLLNDGTILRDCPTCEKKTAWRKVNTRPGVRRKNEAAPVPEENEKRVSNF